MTLRLAAEKTAPTRITLVLFSSALVSSNARAVGLVAGADGWSGSGEQSVQHESGSARRHAKRLAEIAGGEL